MLLYEDFLNWQFHTFYLVSLSPDHHKLHITWLGSLVQSLFCSLQNSLIQTRLSWSVTNSVLCVLDKTTTEQAARGSPRWPSSWGPVPSLPGPGLHPWSGS